MDCGKPIIEIKNISKKYNITHQQGGYIALRDVLANIFKNPFKFAKHKTKEMLGREKKEEFWALKNISFNVNQGETIGIIGANGAGKSTLLKILTGITPPTTGEIKMHGRVASLLEVGTGFHPELSGRENIFLNGAIIGMTKKEISEKFNEIVEFSGITKFLDTPVKRYSSGMYVRLAFSVAAHMEPDILLVDEVLAVGDAEFQKKCLGKMNEVTKKAGRTILFVSHNMNAIQNLCKKSILLKKGEIVFIGETSEAIKLYLNSNQVVRPSIKIQPQQHVKDPREAEIEKVSIGNAASGPKNNFTINEPISLEVEYTIKLTDRKLSFWLLFVNQHGETIISSFQKDSNDLITPLPGKQKININFDQLGLLPGKYSITIGIFAHNSQYSFEFADWVDSCQFINIEKSFLNGQPFDGRLGMVNEDAKWIITK